MAEVVEAALAEVPATESAPQQEVFNADDLNIGYLVGLDPKGDFVFRVFGKNQGLVELMGIHAHATSRVQAVHDAKVGVGDGLTLEVLRQVQAMAATVERVANTVAPKKPDNKL